MTSLTGVWTALVTPFKANGKLDLDSYRRILDQQKEAGVTGVVPCGTTGESPTLSRDERETLIQTAVSDLRGSGVHVMAGTGGNDTASTVELSRWASEAGVDAILVVTPYYNKPSQTGLEAHFRAVADAVPCPVVLYNVPGRTSVSLSPQTVIRLASHKRIRAIKEATANMAFASEILDQARRSEVEITLLSGDDATFLPFLSVGGHGCISVASNIRPREMVSLYEHFQAGRWKEAVSLHQRMYPLFRDLFVESNPVPIKRAMAQRGLGLAEVRLPLVTLTRENEQLLLKTLKEVEELIE